MAKLFYQGHASLRITTNSGKVIFVDPFAGEGYSVPADLVLVTHDHYDHNALNLINHKESTIVITNKEALSNGTYYDFDYCGVHIQAVPACNKNHPIDQCGGYLLTVDGVLLYIAGDTDYVPYMDEIGKMGVDYCFLPIDGVFNMGPEEATRCANIIKPKHLIPYHSKPGRLIDVGQVMKVSYEHCLLVRPNQEIELTK